MLKRRLALVSVFLLVSGCHVPPLQTIDQSVADLASRPFDEAPVPTPKPVDTPPPTDGAAPGATTPSQDVPRPLAPPDGTSSPFGAAPGTAPKPVDTPPPTDGAAPGAATPSQGVPGSESQPDDVIRISLEQVDRAPPGQAAPPLLKFELTIPKEVPGAETPLVQLPSERAERADAAARLFPSLPPLPEEPVPLPGPNGRPYALEDLQQLAAANSPALRQAASDVEAARGLLIQASLYPNPTIGYQTSPRAISY